MTPACIRVFEIQELTDALAALLGPNDIAHLIRTSRAMQAAMTPSLFRHLRTFFKPDKGNLCESQEALVTLARNIHHTRSWSSDLLNLVFFLYASTSHKGPTSSPPPPPNLDAFQSIVMPPMLQLTKLDLDLSRRRPSQSPCRHFPPDFGYPFATIVRLCSTLQRLSHIRELSLKGLAIKDFRSLHLFASTLLGMDCLRVLWIIFTYVESDLRVASSLFFSCPPSVRCLSIWRLPPPIGISAQGTDEDGEQEEEAGHGADRVLPRRTTALTQLRELHLGDILSGHLADQDFVTMFAHCPALEHLLMYWPYHPDNVDGAAIGRLCPALRKIYYTASKSPLLNGAWPFKTLMTIPKNQVETFDFGGQGGAPLDGEFIGDSLLRHGQSLRTIRIDHRVPSMAIRGILNECVVLEDLNVDLSHIDLGDAVAASPWASSRIRSLKLNIRIEQLPDHPGLPRQSKYRPFYIRKPPVLLPGEERTFERLEVLYRQIGKQKELRLLQLSTREYDASGCIVGLFDGVQPFPGMLRLKDKKKNKDMEMELPGYLELLAGLSKLEFVGSAVVPETDGFKLAEDAEEVDWILEHWPRLRTAGFIPSARMPTRSCA